MVTGHSAFARKDKTPASVSGTRRNGGIKAERLRELKAEELVEEIFNSPCFETTMSRFLQLFLSMSSRNHQLCFGDEEGVRQCRICGEHRAGIRADLTTCYLLTHLLHIPNVKKMKLCFFRCDTSLQVEKKNKHHCCRTSWGEENAVQPHSYHTARERKSSRDKLPSYQKCSVLQSRK